MQNIMQIIGLLILFIITLLCACTQVQPMRHYVEIENEFCIRPYNEFNYLTCEPVVVYIDDTEITIPTNFSTDLASIPSWYWSILSPNNTKLVAPAIIHDYLYSCNEYFDRKEADEILYSALLNNGVSRYTALKMYIAVRIFGQLHYHPDLVCDIPVTVD